MIEKSLLGKLCGCLVRGKWTVLITQHLPPLYFQRHRRCYFQKEIAWGKWQITERLISKSSLAFSQFNVKERSKIEMEHLRVLRTLDFAILSYSRQIQASSQWFLKSVLYWCQCNPPRHKIGHKQAGRFPNCLAPLHHFLLITHPVYCTSDLTSPVSFR